MISQRLLATTREHSEAWRLGVSIAFFCTFQGGGKLIIGSNPAILIWKVHLVTQYPRYLPDWNFSFFLKKKLPFVGHQLVLSYDHHHLHFRGENRDNKNLSNLLRIRASEEAAGL